MGEGSLKLFLWLLPFLILAGSLTYGYYQENQDLTLFLTGDIQEIPAKLEKKFSMSMSESPFSESDFKMGEIRTDCSFNVSGSSPEQAPEDCKVSVDVLLKSPFPFPVKLKSLEIDYIKNDLVVQKISLKREVTLEPDETAVLTLEGELKDFLETSEYDRTIMRFVIEFMGFTFEGVSEGRGR
jgi:hypothetical protein